VEVKKMIRINKIVNYTLFLLGFLLIITSFCMFFIGFHNVDLAMNVLRVSYMNKLNYFEFYDRSLYGKASSFDEVYIIGLNLMVISIFILFLGSFWFFSNLDKLRK
jgi:hypothetical protein